MKSKHQGFNQNSHLFPFSKLLARLPYWFLAIVLLATFIIWKVFSSESYAIIFKAVGKGVTTTIYVSLLAYLFSISLGLIFGLLSVSRLRIVREISTFYIEIVRGVPMLVILYYIAFVGAPELVRFLNWIGGPLIENGLIDKLSIRNINFVWRAILALTIGYSAFIAEIFRAGIESIGSGQMEASLALGMTRWQAMLFVILPQAIRTVLPPLGNEFVAMIKDSALVSALGVQDITQIGKVYSSSTFMFFETYNIVAYLYLLMTISLSLMVRALERFLEKAKR
ncbi:amino acid ABC transporter permease [bacterium]|nr:amino acid ABC transporter permease [bacterium]